MEEMAIELLNIQVIIIMVLVLMILRYMMGTKRREKTKVGYAQTEFHGDLAQSQNVCEKSELGIVDPSAPMTKQKLIEEIFYASHNAADDKLADRCIALLKKLPEAVNFRLEPSGYTPFLDACWTGNYKLVEYMLQHGADVESTAEDGNTPLYLATYSYIKALADTPFNPALIETLIKFGCKINHRKRHGNTPLHIAAKMGKFELARWLLVNHADALAVTSTGMTAADIARLNGHMKLAKFLTVTLDGGDMAPTKEQDGIPNKRRQLSMPSGSGSSRQSDSGSHRCKKHSEVRRKSSGKGTPDMLVEDQCYSDN